MNQQLNQQPIEYYLSLKYPITLYPEDEGYTVLIKDLPGCITQVDTIEEVISMITEAKEQWISVAYEYGQVIPLPSEM